MFHQAYHALKDLNGEKIPGLGGKLSHGFMEGKSGLLLDLPFAAMEVANAERGEVPAIAISKVAGYATYPIANAILFAGLSLALPGIGTGIASLLTLAMSAGVTGVVEGSLHKGIRTFSQLDHRIRHLEMGGSYTDSETSYSLRMRAISDMNASMQPSRRYLGQEALLFHDTR